MNKAQLKARSERSFGLSVGTVLVLIALYQLWRERITAAEILGGIGALLVVLGWLRPSLLRRPNALWWRFAAVMAFINSRIILSAIFLLVMTPIALAWRIIGKDPLALRRRSWAGWSAYPPRYRDRAHFTRMY